MDLSLTKPNDTPSYRVKRIVKVRKTMKVWDFRHLTGNDKDVYCVTARKAHSSKKWSYQK